MGRKRGDCASRGELTDKGDRAKQDMRDQEGEMDKTVCDVETVRETLDALEFGGTSEGADAVEMSVKGAEGVTENVFDSQDGELDRIQAEGEDFEGDLGERTDRDNADLDKLSDASSRMETQETVTEFLKAKDAALDDLDVLKEMIGEAQDARQESENTQSDYGARVHSRG